MMSTEDLTKSQLSKTKPSTSPGSSSRTNQIKRKPPYPQKRFVSSSSTRALKTSNVVRDKVGRGKPKVSLKLPTAQPEKHREVESTVSYDPQDEKGNAASEQSRKKVAHEGGTPRSETEAQLSEIFGDKFYYFGYGSNMLTKRLHVQNPTAVRVGPAVLKNYRLDFHSYARRWNGAPATIMPDPNFEVHGSLYKIDLINLHDLDLQEGVKDHFYEPIRVQVQSGDDVYVARSYQMTKKPTLSYYVRPSKTYLKCMVKGAMETGVAEWYIAWLKSLKHNNRVQIYLEKYLDLRDIILGKPLITKERAH